MASSYLAWIGCVLLGDDYTSGTRVLDMASVTGGWYLSRKSLNSQKSAMRFNKNEPERLSLAIQPTLRFEDRNLISGVNLNLKF